MQQDRERKRTNDEAERAAERLDKAARLAVRFFFVDGLVGWFSTRGFSRRFERARASD